MADVLSDDDEKQAAAADVLKELFGVSGAVLVDDFSCAVADGILKHGRLYITKTAVLFYSNIFGHETRRILPFEDIASVHKRAQALVLPALEFTRRDGTTVVFMSFFAGARDEAYEICRGIHAQFHPERYSSLDGDAGPSAPPVAGSPKPHRPSIPATTTPAGAAFDAAAGSRGSPAAASSGTPSAARKTLAARTDDDASGGVGGGRRPDGSSPTNTAHHRPHHHHGHHHHHHGHAGHARGAASGDAADLTAAPPPGAAATIGAAAPSSAAIVDASGGAAHASETATGVRPVSHRPRRRPRGSSSETAPPLPPVPAALWERLGTQRVLCDLVLPVSVDEYYRHFMADGASFSLAEAHRCAGDSSCTISDWTEIRSATDAAGSAAAGGGAPASTATAQQPLVTRTLRYQMPLEHVPFMPRETRVEQLQSMRKFACPPPPADASASAVAAAVAGGGSTSSCCFIMESQVRSLDVPYGDYFHTDDVWVVLPVGSALPVKGHEQAPAAIVQAAVATQREAARAAGVSLAGGPTAGATAGSSPIDGSGSEYFASSSSRMIPQAEFVRLVALVGVTFNKSTVLHRLISDKSVSGAGRFYEMFRVRAMQHVRNVILPATLATSRVGSEGGGSVGGGGFGVPQSSPASSSASTIGGDTGSATSGGDAHGADVASIASTGGSSAASPPFLSPTIGAALADPLLACIGRHDPLLATLPAPDSATSMDREGVVRAYTQLYSSHEAMLAQLRALHRGSAGGSAGAADKSPVAGTAASPAIRASDAAVSTSRLQLIMIANIFVLLLAIAVIARLQLPSSPFRPSS